MEPELYYLCLKCGQEFKNDLKIAVCQTCLKQERENYEKGIPSKYITVLRFLKSQIKE
jgi:NMD protein affecting ribosome stability and mRNA decay